jgi:dipeptidyl aminopeptidase/acylaminoacyl peptidase
VSVDAILHSQLVLLGGRRAFIVAPLDLDPPGGSVQEAAAQAAANLRLVVAETGQARSLTADFDAVVGDILWAPDSAAVYFDTEETGATAYYRIAIGADGAAGKPERVWYGGSVGGGEVAADGHTLVFTRARYHQPPEVYALDLAAKDAAPRAITHTNDALLAPIELRAAESITVSGAGGTPVQMWLIKPPGFDPAKKYPLVFMVHGGPQSPWSDGWSTRWNPELWAAQGYVLAMPNPRGSPGFGQKFTDEISGDWGGKVYDDLLACLAWLKAQPYVDATRMAAAGASYGGYMMNWINGHTDQFRCIVNHDGVFNFWSMYGTTEEVWFDEWEHGIPWENPDFEKFSPHRFAANFKTPTLIIHNELDFRVPVGEGQQLFTLLQRRGVPSKFLSFPDEGHWVLKPKNSELWHQTVFGWLAQYLKR